MHCARVGCLSLSVVSLLGLSSLSVNAQRPVLELTPAGTNSDQVDLVMRGADTNATYTFVTTTNLSGGDWQDGGVRRGGDRVTMDLIPIGSVDRGYYRVRRSSEEDFDLDGLGNLQEFDVGANPESSDSDNDQMPDGWEVRYGFSPTDDGTTNAANGGDADVDDDGIPNLREFARGTDPTNSGSVNISLFADSQIGSDSLDGLSPALLGDGRGPKQGVAAAVNSAISGDRIDLAPGVYSDDVFDQDTNSLTYEASGDVEFE